MNPLSDEKNKEILIWCVCIGSLKVYIKILVLHPTPKVPAPTSLLRTG